jgi:quercetin dioxygenase-like cupin family protein
MNRILLPLFLVALVPVVDVRAAAPMEAIRNEQVRVMRQTLAPGESAALAPDRPRAVVYVDAGSVEASGKAQEVKRGDTSFEPKGSPIIKNESRSDLRIVWVEFLGGPSDQTWGTTGLAASYKLLFENPFARAYDVKIAAGTTEPQHTHHTRVVICLSGAELEHRMPDGRRESSSLKTDEIAWRPGATHEGHNIGKTDLWVIVIEPK